MGWVLEAVATFVAELVGHQLGHSRPWWVESVASFGCLLVLGLIALPFLLLLR